MHTADDGSPEGLTAVHYFLSGERSPDRSAGRRSDRFSLLVTGVAVFAGFQVYDLLKELKVPTPKNVYVSRDG